MGRDFEIPPESEVVRAKFWTKEFLRFLYCTLYWSKQKQYYLVLSFSWSRMPHCHCGDRGFESRQYRNLLEVYSNW